MRRLAPALLFCALVFCASRSAMALDRNAFSFPRYDLRVTLDPHQHGLAAEGTVDVRNISQRPQREVSLQISSSLRWLSVRAGGVVGDSEVEWLAQSYTSDIDHTGVLSEAIVKFEKPVAPGETVRLNLRYSGAVQKDSTRLERIGTPADVARRSDWDEIGDSFTALRGAGFVVWYPVSMDAANLSQGNELFETLRGWRERESSAVLGVQLSRVAAPEGDESRSSFISNGLVANGSRAGRAIRAEFRGVEPVLVLLGDPAETVERPGLAAYYTAAHTDYARDYMVAAETVIPRLEEWFGTPRRKVVLVELTDPNALPYDAGEYYFVPMRRVPAAAIEVALARPVVHAMLESPRPWIGEGLAGFAEALIRERQAGRRAALAYLGQFSSALAAAEAESHGFSQSSSQASPQASLPPERGGPQALITTADEVFFRTKAGYVWWMLREMVGDRALQSALAHYHGTDDLDTGYVQRLIEKEASPKRDLEAFFDDWVYRDRGLPQLRVQSAYARQTLGEQTVTAVTVENLGEAWCEVPVTVRSRKGENTARVVVPGKSKATVRVSLEGAASEAEVNDGSVPESDGRDHVIPVTVTPPVEH